MASNALLSFFLILSSFIHIGFSDLDQILPGLAQVPVLKDAQCMKKLLPCQQFLKSPNNPTPACCVPLSEMQINETDCLCTFFNNPQLLTSINVSKDDVLKLPNACGVDVDVSKCSTAASPSSLEGLILPAEDTSEDATSSTKMITPYGIHGFVALLIALAFSAYWA
ncbi:non-specific lipid transfer protein GPI-anchored 9-like [Gastrolobium bilobum]|uniref:non-specific lipid transfer protein GPI-anchored 9-like n=1 Tax=Gastrolobium bilobum TaxID=150636 RepID=UPI002AB2A975|nr:non-specific lipid transfer protein GPI-anchored 9-like [Gastrolobium bilobum]